jgi:hypothetical protein
VELGGVILHDVNATQLPSSVSVASTLTANGISPLARMVIIFQFPHNGTKKINTNRALLGLFFCAAAGLIKGRPKSQIIVSLSPGQGGTEADAECRRSWGNSWQVVNEAQRAPSNLVLRSAFSFDAPSWASVGYGSRGRGGKGLGEFRTSGAVTHVFVPENTGVAGVCCPIYAHDVGFWCNPRGASSSNGDEKDAETRREAAEFVEAEFVQCVRAFVGSDWLLPCTVSAVGEVSGGVELLNAYVRTGDEPCDRTDPVYDRKRQTFTHRYTYRLQCVVLSCPCAIRAHSIGSSLFLFLLEPRRNVCSTDDAPRIGRHAPVHTQPLLRPFFVCLA